MTSPSKCMPKNDLPGDYSIDLFLSTQRRKIIHKSFSNTTAGVKPGGIHPDLCVGASGGIATLTILGPRVKSIFYQAIGAIK